MPLLHDRYPCVASCVLMMAGHKRAGRLLLGLVVWMGLGVPTCRRWLEADMALHMLVQLPLLAWVGWQLGQALPSKVSRCLAPWNFQGISGLLLASLMMTVWMLPVALDAAINQPLGILAKFLGVPLLLGLPCALSWPQAGFIVRGVFLVELIATLFRTGWLYLAAPVRLCTSYLLDAQQITGQGLLAGASLILVLLVLRLIVGPLRTPTGSGTRAGLVRREP